MTLLARIDAAIVSQDPTGNYGAHGGRTCWKAALDEQATLRALKVAVAHLEWIEREYGGMDVAATLRAIERELTGGGE
jgi:hypothetical protein